MDHDRFDLARRDLLTTAGAGTAVAGCLDQEQQAATTEPSPTTEPTQRQTPTSQSVSGRTGSTVFYDPDDRGPYADGQEALADVPDGGTLVLAATVYDVESEGRLLIERPVHLRGAGEKWSRLATWDDDGNRTLTPLGTRIRNDSVAKPSIEYRGNENKMLQGVSINGLTVNHQTDAPAVRFRDTIATTVSESSISCPKDAPKGIKYERGSFFARVVRTRVSSYDDIGIHVAGNGYSHEFYSCWVASSSSGVTQLQTEVDRTIILGGEYGGRNHEDATSIRFYNPEGADVMYGGLVLEPGIEHSARCIDIDGEGPVDNVQMYHTLLSLYAQDSDTFKGGGAGVRFGNARNCKLVNPIATSQGNIAHWTAQSSNCGIVTDAGTHARCSIIDDGAREPYVSVTGSANEFQLENMPTDVPTTVEYYTKNGRPVLHDGSAWKQPASYETVQPDTSE
jgi:hypothetical protein